MILKTAANYNDEGGYIEAWKNSDGTTEVKLIPKNGGGDEGKNGILSVTISPAITTTPALDSLFPIYWEDLTDEEKDGVLLSVTYAREQVSAQGDDFNITVEPTREWYASYTNEDDEFIIGGKGEALTIPAHLMYTGLTELQMMFSNGNTQETSTEFFSVNVTFRPV